ncbi:type IIS restriction endonuclease [Candidatus Desulfofervidus auxilii]|uniref:site-specific DNA-methyltransferase (adenine-specific) n=1 Tax=Desulfofervidus auxilii TaxID=1621989 RepID=A0A7U4TJ63_DESA2|nr:DNA methyltransferase [Candidatus Desulfofervidus auxilii]AMM42160.1 type IIS restriction endonuclease [Candidatus Desulfofervidus auxilii]
MIDIKQFIESHIPQMDSPEKVYQLFQGLGYKTLDPSYKGKEAWGLREKDKEFIKQIYAIANYKKKFQIFLVELKTLSPGILREIPLYFEREIQYPFFIFTPDYQNYTFVLIEKIREDVGVWKRKIIKLNLDRENAYYTDKWILSEIALKDPTDDPKKIFKSLQQAFGIQKVTKRFFVEYHKNFDMLIESLKRNNRGIPLFNYPERLYAFAQRFMGRLMFLYFLQKKGWLAGDKKFITNWFNKTKRERKNFYQSILKPLFFEILNRKRPNDNSPFGKIPFLNGGLFEKDYDELVYIPDTTIENILKFLNFYNFTISEEVPLEVEVAVNPEMLGKIFESMLPEYERGEKGTFYTPRPIVHYMCRESLKEYLVSFSDIPRYKILPLIEEGRVKQLTATEAKKVYELLRNVKILDPAVGSGAFLVGMMQEIIRLRKALGSILEEKILDAELKREIIQENLYGVDIEPEAIEIARLRLWLSLVVDEEKPEPLPNLDYKILQGNSLIGTIKGYNLLKLFESGKLELQIGKKEVIPSKQLELFSKIETLKKEKLKIEEKIKKGAYTLSQGKLKFLNFQLYQINNQLKKLKPKDNIKVVKNQDMFGIQVEVSDYHRLRNQFAFITDPLKRKEAKEKLQLYEKEIFRIAKEQIISKFRQDINNIRERYKFRDIPKTKQNKINKLELTISEIDRIFSQYEKDKVKPFFLPQWEFKDIYREKGGFDIVIANPPYVRTQKLSDLPYREDLKNHHGYIDDLYVHFTFRAFELARSRGIITFITSDTYLTLAWKERMRRLLQDYRLRRLILTPKAFEATVNTAIYIAQKEVLSDYNLTFIDAREISSNEDQNWEDRLIVFEELKEIEAYDTQTPVRLGNKELEVSYSRYADIGQYRVPIEIYKKSVKRVFFPPTEKNLKIYQKFMPKMNELYEKWWDKIKSSKDIQKHKKEIKGYLSTLRPGDITLLGLITEGGQGLATADNGRFLAVLEGTEEAKRIEERLKDFEKKWKKKDSKIYETYQELLKRYPRNEALDKLRRKFGEKKLGFPRGFIYKIIKKEDVFDIASHLSKITGFEDQEAERQRIIFEGLETPRYWVSFETTKSAEDVYFWSPNVICINWSKEVVKWFFRYSGKNAYRMPVIRNPHLYFCKGVILSRFHRLRAKVVGYSIFDDSHPFLTVINNILGNNSEKMLSALLNSSILGIIFDEFYATKKFELNALRLLPIVIPSASQQKGIETLVNKAIAIQKKRYATKDEDEKSRLWQELQEVQRQISRKVEEIYGI